MYFFRQKNEKTQFKNIRDSFIYWQNSHWNWLVRCIRFRCLHRFNATVKFRRRKSKRVNMISCVVLCHLLRCICHSKRCFDFVLNVIRFLCSMKNRFSFFSRSVGWSNFSSYLPNVWHICYTCGDFCMRKYNSKTRKLFDILSIPFCLNIFHCSVLWGAEKKMFNTNTIFFQLMLPAKAHMFLKFLIFSFEYLWYFQFSILFNCEMVSEFVGSKIFSQFFIETKIW